MQKPPEHYPRGYITSVARFVEPLAMDALAEAAATNYGSTILRLETPENLRVNILSWEELRQLYLPTAQIAHDARVALQEAFETNPDLKVATRGLTAVGKHKRIFIAKLEQDEALLEERCTALEILQRISGRTLVPSRYNFQVYMGSLFRADLKTEIRYALDPYVPAALSLGKISVKER